jgi:hypothetical protein
VAVGPPADDAEPEEGLEDGACPLVVDEAVDAGGAVLTEGLSVRVGLGITEDGES